MEPHQMVPTLNEEEIENIINPSDPLVDPIDPSAVLENHEGLSMKDTTPMIEDIVNPSLEPTSLLSHETQESGMTPFSPLMANAPLTQDTNIIRRGTPVAVYPGNSGSNNMSGMEPLLSDSLLRYNVSGKRLLQNKQQPKSSATNKRKLTTTKTRPAFVNKLWSMVNDTSNQKLIHWSKDGKSFIVTKREQFVHEILPKYFKHSNFASFVRQLNMYGWHKVQDVRSGSIQNNSDERWQFQNEHFVRDKEELLDKIVRQKSSGSTNKDSLITSGDDIDIGILLTELETVKYNQMAIAEDLKRISKDNELLWKENMIARERHQTQQQRLERILQFLASLYGSNTIKLLNNDLYKDVAGNDPKVDPENDNNTRWDNNASNRPRLLLKNRSTSSSSSQFNRDELLKNSPIQEIDRGSIHQSNSVASNLYIPQSDGRISEVPFETTSPGATDSSFFNDLQSNIRKQGESIQEIQDWISKVSPETRPEPASGNSSHNTVNNNKFDFQDYLAATPSNTGLTPLLQEEPDQELTGKHERIDDNGIEEIQNPSKKSRR